MSIDLTGLTPEQILDYESKRRPSIWSQRHTKLRGQTYRFERLDSTGSLDLRPEMLNKQRKFLQQPLDDQHKWKSFQKSRQCGASENHVRETLWFADTHAYTKQVYVFPTFDQVADFSKTRIEEVMKDSPYLTKRMGIDPVTRKKLPGEDPVDNVRLRRVGNSFIFFRSGNTPRAGEGIDCDIVYFDIHLSK